MATNGSSERGDAITLMVVPGGTGNIRRYHVPRHWIRNALGTLAGLALVFAACMVDYVVVRSRVSELERLRHENQVQSEEIASYAERVERISSELSEVSTFERKLRIIANLESPDALPLRGVGGLEGDGLEARHLSGLTRGQRQREMLASLDHLGDAAEEQKENLAALIEHLEKQSSRLAATPSIAPAKGWITSDFGYRQSPFTGRREFHRGLDIAARQGTPIIAPARGRVRYTGEDGALGRSVIVRHGYGIETMYGHLAEVDVKPGQELKRGDRIGLMGSSGRSTGPHLHYQILVNGKPVSPKNYILD